LYIGKLFGSGVYNMPLLCGVLFVVVRVLTI
jgi:hypothetical protein